MAEPEALVRTSEAVRFRLRERAGVLWGSRQVLRNLASKELKVKYKSSVLGVVWSMLNPVLYLAIFSLVFGLLLRVGDLEDYPFYLLSGLLPWTLYSTGLQGTTTSVTGNAQLVPKVAFPREILPLAAIRAQVTNFFFQFGVLVAALLVFGYPFLGPALLLVPAAFAVLLVFLTAVGFATSALNVRYRDTGHLVDLALLAWFWSTPIVYPAAQVAEAVGRTGFQLYLANPLANVVLAFQRGIYGGNPDNLRFLPAADLSWYWMRLGAVGVASVVLLYLGWRLFFRMSGDFAEDL